MPLFIPHDRNFIMSKYYLNTIFLLCAIFNSPIDYKADIAVIYGDKASVDL